jgi:hypothetical protein
VDIDLAFISGKIARN